MATEIKKKVIEQCLETPVNKTISWQLNYISSVYVGIPLFVIGFLTNICCLILWRRLVKRARNRNISCGIYLAVIAVVDLGTITSFFVVETLRYLTPDITQHSVYNTFYAYICYPAHMFFTYLSFWLIAGVDTCRLTLVIFPFKLRQGATRTTNTIIVVITVYVFAVNVPNFFSYKSTHKEGVPCLTTSTLYNTPSFKDYTFWFQCVFLTLLPWCIIVIVNITMLVYKLIVPVYVPEWKRRGKEMGRVLLAVSVWFVTVISWQCATQCFFLRNQHKPLDNREQIERSFAFAKLGIVINSSSKFFVYLIASKTFRKSFVHFITNNSSSYVSELNQSIETNNMTFRNNNNKKKSKSINAISPMESSSSKFSKEGEPPAISRRRLFLIQELSSIDIKL